MICCVTVRRFSDGKQLKGIIYPEGFGQDSDLTDLHLLGEDIANWATEFDGEELRIDVHVVVPEEGQRS
jgi:phage protein U